MRNLIAAGLARLKKDVVFRACVIFMVLLSILFVIMRYNIMPDSPPDPLFFLHVYVIGLLLAVFCSLYLGAEHHDGALRNKLTVGHTRLHVYLSSLAVCLFAGLILNLVSMLIVALIGIPLIGAIHIPPAAMALMMLCCLMMTAAYCALFVALGMNIQNKAYVVVAMALVLVVLMVAAFSVDGKLQEMEYLSGYTLSDTGMAPIEPVSPNPRYLTGKARDVYQFILDFLPSGQTMQLGVMSVVNPGRLPLYSLAVVLFSTALGIALFRKKDLK